MINTEVETTEEQLVYLGLEGGGTRSTAVLSDRQGKPLKEMHGGPANLKLLSDRQLHWLLRSYAGKVELSEHQRLAAVAVGLAGARTEVDLERLRRAVTRVWPGIPTVVTNDLETALAAAKTDATAVARVLILSGTGSCCFARANDGRTAKAGGRGHIIGDRGSACDIAQRALRALMAHLDRTQTWPRVGVHMLEALALNSPDDLIPWSMEAKKDELGSLATAVFAADRERDPIAREVLSDAAQCLADDAHVCAARVATTSDRVQFVFNGGVLLKNPAFAKAVETRLKTRWPRAVFSLVEGLSSLGAVHLAMEASPLGTTEDTTCAPTVVEPLVSGLSPDHPAFSMDLLRRSPTEKRNPKSVKLSSMAVTDAIDLMLMDSSGITKALKTHKTAIQWTIRKVAAAFRNGGHLFYVGAGTSGRLGVLDASECPPTFRAPREQVQGIIAGGQRALWSAVEGAEDDIAGGVAAMSARGVGEQDVVVGIAASGRTPFVWGALARAAELGATTVLICFHPEFATLKRRKGDYMPDKIISPNLGPEVLTGSTRLKAGTATKMLLNLFTTLAMVQTGKVKSNLMVDLNPSNVKLRARAIWIVRELTGCDEENAVAALTKAGWVVKDALMM